MIGISHARFRARAHGEADDSVVLMHNLAAGLVWVADLTAALEYIMCNRAWPLEALATAIERELVSRETLAF